jgi:tRNA threonylcarbamoyladenosine biosynthesis protein TsaE
MDLGWEDYLGQGIIIIEWAEKMKFNLDAIYVTFSIEENETRRILIS